MSRSAHNRAARRARGTAPRGTVPTRALIPSEARRTNVAPISLRTDDVPRRKNRRPGSDKGQGEWRTTSPYYSTPATIDVRWSA